MRLKPIVLMLMLSFLLLLTAVACGEKAEDTGSLEKSAEEAGQAMQDAAEEAGDAMKDAAEETGEAMEEAAEEVKDAAEDATKHE